MLRLPGRGAARLLLLGAALSLGPAGNATAAPGDESSRDLRELSADSTRPLAVRRAPGERRPYFVTGRVPVGRFSDEGSAAARARDFADEYGEAFGAAGDELDLEEVEWDRLGMTHVRLEQRYRGLEVFGRELLVHLDGNAVTVANGDLTPVDGLSTDPEVSRARAAATARSSGSSCGPGRS